MAYYSKGDQGLLFSLVFRLGLVNKLYLFFLMPLLQLSLPPMMPLQAHRIVGASAARLIVRPAAPGSVRSIASPCSGTVAHSP